MNKTELIDAMAADAGITKAAAKKAVAKKAAPKKAVTKKVVTKKAAPKAKPAEKKAAFTVAKPNEEGYTAEELWIKQLAEKDHDCRLPRGVV